MSSDDDSGGSCVGAESDTSAGAEYDVHPGVAPSSSLTGAQRSVLALALDEGYFSVPRETSVVELADRLDRSPGEVARQLRGGVGSLVDALVAEPTDADPASALDILRHPERVALLYELRGVELPRSVDSLADRVQDVGRNDGGSDEATWNTSGAAGREDGDPGLAGRLDALALHHVHLPVLEASGILHYDSDAREVTAFDAGRLDSILEAGVRLLSSLHSGRSNLLAANGTGVDLDRLSSLVSAGQSVLTSLQEGRSPPLPPGQSDELEGAPAAFDGLSATQRTVLWHAHRSGCFETPPASSLKSVAEDLGLSVREADAALNRALESALERTDL